ncbi:stage ii sporulation protein [Lucifera butyrica]|uniref:Stage ii sporulation protein n=2 Tax=Lucifera butyrica TaxID=1351585 RepID=A0A498R5F6_9FIRM|nr:stage ii sporulation protein [Lucifera butyrica]
MKAKLTFFLLILGSIFFCFKPGYAAADHSPLIHVGIWTHQSSVIVSADCNFTIVDTETSQIVGKFAAKQKVIVAEKPAGIVLNGVPAHARTLRVNVTDEKGITEVNRRGYRGVIEIDSQGTVQGLTVVNTLPLEEYLYGVIGREISTDWPLEAVKAQAVAARTYALYNLREHGAGGIDVYATTDNQVYGGTECETARGIQAVNATQGLVITYHAKPIAAYFHSSAGGYTENSENVWGTALPYLRGVEDFDQGTPHYKWEKQWTAADLNNVLRRAGYKIGALQAIELSPLTSPPVNAADRGVSGRIKSLQLIGSAGRVQIQGTKLRTLLGLPSTLFDIKVVVPVQKAIDLQVTDTYGDTEDKTIEINLPPAAAATGIMNNPAFRRITGSPREMIVFSGFGWGHGVGMSQWGAKVMAEKAPAGAAAYFETILKHYYHGVEIEKLY